MEPGLLAKKYWDLRLEFGLRKGGGGGSPHKTIVVTHPIHVTCKSN